MMITWLNTNFAVDGLWLRKESAEDEDNEDFVISDEDQISESSFNSRGPRSLYRGLEMESDSDFLWDYGVNYHDFDFEYDTHF